MTHNILEPLQLAAGSHKEGSGKGCAMNVISWENGDSVITDFPACSDDYLSSLVQIFNDDLSDPKTGLLSPENSMMVLEIGHMTVGTAYHELSGEKMVEVYQKLVMDPFEKLFQRDSFDSYLEHIRHNIRQSFFVGGVSYAARAASSETNSLLSTFTAKMRYDFLKQHIELFRELTGTTAVEVPVEKTAEAVQKMLVCAV